MHVYFILPVGSDPDYPSKRTIIDRVLWRTGLAAHFPFEANVGAEKTSLEETLAAIRKARCVISDLANERPSCYFETGLAQASGAEVHLIAPIGTRIHQVANRSEVRSYADLDEYQSLLMQLLSDLDRGDQSTA